jgi:hypothetical protein
VAYRIEITTIVCAAIALLFVGTSSANSTEFERGEWRRVGATFVCKADAPKGPPSSAVTPEDMLKACMRMGPFVIGGDARTLAALGTPHRAVPQAKGAKALAWFLGEPNRQPYFVATVLNERIVVLQMTGPATAKAYSFNNVNLGDSTQTLTQRFGVPFRVVKSELPGTDMWSYPPWPFSFEVKAGRVTSVRIVDPAQWE